MRRQLFYCLTFLSFGFSGLQAQNLYVQKSAGTQTTYPIANITKLTFSGGNVVVETTTGNTNFPLSDLRNLNFTDLALGTATYTALNQYFIIYPNPATNVLHLSSTEESINSIEIISMNGHLLLQEKQVSNTTQLDVSKLANGLYLCKINTGKTSQTIKFLKQ